jgi:AcrR family transcriptional regulator
LPELVKGLPPAPPSELAPALDAASRCFARHGITRTSMTDIGRELGVSRSNIYRQLGSIDRTVRLLLARELHQLIAGHLVEVVTGATGPDAIIGLLETVVHYSRRHPVLTKVMADEPQLIGPYLLTEMTDAVAQVESTIEPVLKHAMATGLIATQDAGALAAWLVRLAVILILDPPRQPIRPMLDQLLLPALDPKRGG